MKPNRSRILAVGMLVVVTVTTVATRGLVLGPFYKSTKPMIASQPCSASSLPQSEAISIALTIAANKGFINAVAIESQLVTGNELIEQYHVEPESVDDCYWYVTMTGSNTRTRRPMLPPSVTPPPTPNFTKLHVVFNAVSKELIYTSLRGEIVATPVVPTSGPSVTPMATLTQRPLPTLPDW